MTLLTLLTVPSTGGDTAWTSQVAAYERLSEPIRHLLEGLRAEHSGFPQADNARRDGRFVRREPVRSDHPIVRVHPVGVDFGFTLVGNIDGLRCRSRAKKRYSSILDSRKRSSD